MVAGTGFEPMTFARGYEERARRLLLFWNRLQTKKALNL
jgi:hypothetical protein